MLTEFFLDHIYAVYLAIAFTFAGLVGYGLWIFSDD